MRQMYRYIAVCVYVAVVAALIFDYFVSQYYFKKVVSTIRVDKAEKMRIFCMIITHPNNFYTKAITVSRLWAKDCDKYFFLAKLDNDLPTNVSYEYAEPFSILQPAGYHVEDYYKLTDKVFNAMIHVYQKYEPYDWYLKADDDSFIFMDNLRDFLKNKNSSGLLTYGYNLKNFVERGYQHGGAGYVLGKDAFQQLANVLSSDYSFCSNSGAEDVDVHACLRRLGFEMGSSLDAKERERFHHFSLSTHVKGNYIYRYGVNEMKGGVECCSDQTISFHYVRPDQQEKLYYLFKRLKNTSKRPYNVTGIIYELYEP